MKACATKRRGFSLIELLVVVALMGVMLTLLAPSLQSIRGGSELTAAGDLMASHLRLARQLSISRNRRTELRLFSHPDESGTTRIRSMVIYIEGFEASQTATPLGRQQNLPASVTIDQSTLLSPLLQQVSQRSGLELGIRLPVAGLEYTAYLIRFRPDGSAEVPGDNSQNFLTLRPVLGEISSGQLPANYAVVQILAQNGQVRIYRP